MVFTSPNRTVYASAQKRLGLKSAGSHASFRQIVGGGLCFAKPFYAAANFVNSRNVIRNCTLPMCIKNHTVQGVALFLLIIYNKITRNIYGNN